MITVLSVGPILNAQDVFVGGAVDNNWSTASNWQSGVVPTSGPTSQLQLGRGNSTQDLGTPFELNSLEILDHTVSGSPIRFVGADSHLVTNSQNSEIGSDVEFPDGLTVNDGFLRFRGQVSGDSLTVTDGTVVFEDADVSITGTTKVEGGLFVSTSADNTPLTISIGDIELAGDRGTIILPLTNQTTYGDVSRVSFPNGDHFDTVSFFRLNDAPGVVNFNSDIAGVRSVRISDNGQQGIRLNGQITDVETLTVRGKFELGLDNALGDIDTQVFLEPGFVPIPAPVFWISVAEVSAVGGPRVVDNLWSIEEDSFNSVQYLFSGSENLAFTNTSRMELLDGDTFKSTNSATTTINREINARFGSVIHAAAGNFVLGNPNSFSGFKSAGDLIIDPGATLTLQSRGFIDLPPQTELDNSTLAAVNGFALNGSENLLGNGTVQGGIAASIGSIIAATSGNLSLGDANSVSGFFSDGNLFTNEHTVTINDKNEAVLGALTTLGDGTNGGALVAGAANPSDTTHHFFVEEGKNVLGRGNIAGNFKNNGHVIGDGFGSLSERIVFDAPWIVSGRGTFENTLVLGTFSPGESPGISDGLDQAFGGEIVIELGGATPGNGSNHHDQVQDSGTIQVLDSATLSVVPYEEFMPLIGDEFVVMTWEEGIIGSFDDVTVDPWFTERGLGFDIEFEAMATGGQLVLTATAVPEPSSGFLFCFSLAALSCRRKRS